MAEHPGFPAAASREAVLARAVALVAAGERLEVRALAQATGVGRTTLYRWFGDRTGLLSAVLWELTEQAWRIADREATGVGPEHVADLLRRFLTIVRDSAASTALLRDEPRDALAALMSPRGAVQRRAVGRTLRLISAHSDLRGSAARDAAEVLTQVAMTVVWASVIAGREPDLEAAVTVCRRLLV